MTKKTLELSGLGSYACFGFDKWAPPATLGYLHSTDLALSSGRQDLTNRLAARSCQGHILQMFTSTRHAPWSQTAQMDILFDMHAACDFHPHQVEARWCKTQSATWKMCNFWRLNPVGGENMFSFYRMDTSNQGKEAAGTRSFSSLADLRKAFDDAPLKPPASRPHFENLSGMVRTVPQKVFLVRLGLAVKKKVYELAGAQKKIYRRGMKNSSRTKRCRVSVDVQKLQQTASCATQYESDFSTVKQRRTKARGTSGSVRDNCVGALATHPPSGVHLTNVRTQVECFKLPFDV